MDVETLDELRFKAHKNACEKGFHDMVRSSRHWLILALSEMFEAIEADRVGKHSITHGEFCELISRGEEFKFAFERYVKDSTEDELADVVIRLLDLSGLKRIVFKRELKKYKYSNKMPITDFAFNFATELVSASVTEKDISRLLSMIISYAEARKINIQWHIMAKMEYNKTRERLNGKNY